MSVSQVAQRVAGIKLDRHPEPPVLDQDPDDGEGLVEVNGDRRVPATRRATRRRRPVRRVTIMVPQFTRLLGIIYLLTGVAGFVLGAFKGQEVTTLLIFDLNPVHSGLHTAVGLAMIAATLAPDDVARVVCTLAGGTYLAIGVVGLFLIGGGDLNVLALNQADNALHVLSGGLAVFVGLTGEADDDAIVYRPS